MASAENDNVQSFLSSSLTYRALEDNSRTHSKKAAPLPDAFSSLHEPALALEPTLDARAIASFRPEMPQPTQQVLIYRPIYTVRDIDERYELPETDLNCAQLVEQTWGKISCSKQCAKQTIIAYVPIIDTLRNYKVREMFLIDLLCGLTIGMVNVAHGMTHALLANVLPVIGLYASFYPVWLYSFLGTSKTMAYGTLSITSILVGNSVLPIAQSIALPEAEWNAMNSTNSYDDYKIRLQTELAICISFVSGLIQLGAGIFHLGFMTVYFADAMVTGFTTATMIYVFTSQAKYVLGLHFAAPTGIANIFLTWILIFQSLYLTNWITFAMSATTISVLLVFKYFINPYLLSKLRIRFPIEALVLVCATLLSKELNLAEQYNVSIVGNMTNGLPPPRVPDVKYMDDVVGVSFIIAIVNFAVTVSLAEVLARKNNMEIEPNQECFAYGICNFLSSFFLCLPTGGAVSRSYIQDSMHPKSQIVGIAQSFIILIVLLWLTTFFSSLPQCVLAAVVLVALSAIGEHFVDAARLWRISKIDFLIWAFSFASTVSLDIQIGLVLSVIFSFIMLIVRGQLANSHILGNIPGTDLYRSVTAYKRATEICGIKIFRFCGEIHFATAKIFRTALYRKTGLDPRKLLESLQQTQSGDAMLLEEQKALPKFVILDMSMCCFVDYGGLRVLKQVIDEYKAADVTVVLAACPETLQRNLIRAGFYGSEDITLVYVTVHDAVTYAKSVLIS